MTNQDHVEAIIATLVALMLAVFIASAIRGCAVAYFGNQGSVPCHLYPHQ